MVCKIGFASYMFQLVIFRFYFYNVRFLIGFLIMVLLSIYCSTVSAATYYLTTNGRTAAQTPSNWNTGGIGGGGTAATNFTTSGDVFIISSGIDAVFASNTSTTFASNVTLEVNGTFQVGTGANNQNTALTITGTVIFNATNSTQATIPTGGNPNTNTTFTLSSGASLITANQNGIVGATNATFSSATAGRAVVTFDTSANYEFSGATQSTLGLPATVNNLTFSGSGTKTIQAATTISGNVNIAAGATFNSSTFTHLVAGGWTNNGIHTSTGTVHFNGSSAQSISASAFNNIQFSGSGTKTATGALAVTGNVAINSGTTWTAGSFTHNVGGSWTRDGTFTATGSTINFDGSTAANIGASNFNHVIFSGAGTKTATGALNMTGSLTISNNWSAANFTHTVQGNWTNNGSFIPGTSTISLNGATPQLVAGSNSTTFYNLAMNGTGLKSLGISTQVSNLITLTVGVLDIGIYNLTVTTNTSGGNASSYVRATGIGETPAGRLIQSLAAAQTKTFPVGDTSYNPISITNNEPSGTEAFGVRLATATILESNVPAKTLPRKWYIRKIQSGTSSITIAMTYNPGEGPSDLNTTSASRYGAFNGIRWAHGNATTSNGGFTYTASGPISSIYENGYFAIGTDDAFFASKFRVTVLPSTPAAGAPNSSIGVESVNNNNFPSWLLTATGFSISAFYQEDESPYAIGTINGTVNQFTNETTLSGITFPTFTSDSIVVQATRTSGENLAVGLSTPLKVAPGAIWEPYSATTPASLDWTTAIWRRSNDGGATWVYTDDNPSPLELPADNLFTETDLIRIPTGISLTANMGNASVYGVEIEGELILPTGNTLSHTVVNGTSIVVKGILQNAGGTLVNLTPLSPIVVFGGTYLHARDGGNIPLANW